jgi:hypothetical protein
MRVWLQKHKKKEEAKAAAQPATPPVEMTPTAPEVQPVGDGAEKPVDSIEEAPKAEDAPIEQAEGSAENPGDAGQRAGSASAQPNEVGLRCYSLLLYADMLGSCGENGQWENRRACFREIKQILVARANDFGMHSASPFASADFLCRTLPLPISRRSDEVVPLRKT